MKTGISSVLNYNEQQGLRGVIDGLTGNYPFIIKIIL